MWSKIETKINIKIKGDSNGNKPDFQTPFTTISICGTPPRLVHPEFWLLKHRRIVLVCMSSETAEIKVNYFCYRFPKYEGQILISRKYFLRTLRFVFKTFNMTTIIKYLTQYVILDLNNKLD